MCSLKNDLKPVHQENLTRNEARHEKSCAKRDTQTSEGYECTLHTHPHTNTHTLTLNCQYFKGYTLTQNHNLSPTK